jgi:Family of unknown function (DUF6152)
VKSRISLVLIGAVLFVPGVSLLAHHSPSAIFDMKKKISLKGAVTKVDWVNPHIVLYMDTKGDDGSVDNWKFESNPPKWFTKVGIARADFAAAIGQEVTVEIVKALDGSKYGYLQKIVFPNGNLISLEEGQKEEIHP